MLTLHQFPISHYCEKIRWALDYKGIDYQIKNHLPGLHRISVKKLAQETSLPILVDNGKAVQNSSDIITYLDQRFPQKPLTPKDESLRQEAYKWEKFSDEQIGIPVRLICYHTLLNHPNILIPIMTENGPWYGPFLIKPIFPKLSDIMRQKMKINERTAAIANRSLHKALDKITGHLQQRAFLVGEQFTRADLATASLLAPLCKPEGYGLTWPDEYPNPLQDIIEQHSEKLGWVRKLYATYRKPSSPFIHQ